MRFTAFAPCAAVFRKAGEKGERGDKEGTRRQGETQTQQTGKGQRMSLTEGSD